MPETKGPFDNPNARSRSFLLSALSTLTIDKIGAVLVVAFVASWLGFYIITPLPFLQRNAFNATIVLHAMTAAVLVPYLGSLIVGRRLPGGSPLDLAIVAMLGAYLWATAASLNWRVSLEVSLIVLMAVAIFYVLSDRKLFRRWQIEWALMLAVLAAAVSTIWIVAGDYLDWLRLTESVRGSLSFGDLIPPTVPKAHDVGDHPNILGGIFAMSLPFFAVAFVRAKPRLVRGLLAVALMIVLMAMFFTLARSSWLASAGGAAVTVGLLFVLLPGGRALFRRLKPTTPTERFVLGALALGTALAVVATLFAANEVEARPIWLFRDSGTPRLDVMGAGAEMFSDYTLLGTGPGIFGLLYPEYSGRFPDHAVHTHNGFLQTTLDLGVPGILAMFALAGTLGWLLVRGLRKSDKDTKLTFAACAGSFVAFSIFSLMEAPNGFKSPLVILAAVGAIAVLAYREMPVSESPLTRPGIGISAERWMRWGTRAAIPIAIAGLLITWGRIDIGHFYYNEGLTHANAQRWDQAVDDAQRAVDLDPQFAIYRFRLGVVQGQVYLQTGDQAFLNAAIGQMSKGLELEPRSAIGYANLALLLAGTDDRDGTRAAALSALEFANRDPAVSLVAGSALELSGWDDEAVLAYGAAIFQDLGLANSPFWTENPFRVTRFSDIVAKSAVALNDCALLWLSGQPVPEGPVNRQDALRGCVERVIERDMKEDRIVLAEALIRDGEMELAFQQIDDVVTRYPDFGAARTALGRWYAALGDLDRSRLEWLRAGQLKEVEALVLLGDSYEPGRVPGEVVDALQDELRTAASQVQLHLTGIRYYRFKFFRGSPFVILLPGDWRDAVPGRYARATDALERWQRPG
ncbi:MAG: O-antigen ligase family protein [Chloroflexi bacterium]|nr:O-antigen ligase family protein [Chloroflexota bacterium]